ncbi:uncharacterized protein LOC132702423 [Cylas formicarius]|uniref:uncharacterized protein LOC132702423 n=1 Tax=Cylas formicarius TaxID=197179 RepID=UPI002958815A|nr:uncharacterized protein LOC132702423 [Cylas formicarius]
MKIIGILLVAPYIHCFLDLTLRQATPPITRYGDSLFWDSDQQAIYLVDVLSSTVYKHVHGSNSTTSTKIHSNTIGAAIPIRGRPGEFIVPAYQDVLKLEWDGIQDTGKVTKLKKNFDFAKGEQFHSAKADVKGRLWVGTYQVINREKYEFVEGGGSLYMITIKKHSVEIVKEIAQFDFPHWFRLESEREVFFDLAHHPHLSGGISGLIVKKNLVAFNLYGGSALVDVDQDTSKLIYVLPTPVPQPTSLIVGGPHLDTAYVASSDFLLTDEEKQLNPFDSQALFAYTGLKTTVNANELSVVKNNMHGHINNPKLLTCQIINMAIMENFAIVLIVPYIHCLVDLAVRQATTPITRFGESLSWDSEKQAIYLVDVLGSTVYQHVYGSNATTSTKIDSETIGAAIPIRDRIGEFIVPANQDVLKLEWDGTQDTANADAKGRLWVGTYQIINREKYEFVEGGGSSIISSSVEIERKLSNLTFPSAPYIHCFLDLTLRQATPAITRYGDSLFWDSDQQAIYLVDVLSSTVYKHVHGSNSTTSTKIDSETIGAAIPIRGRAGEFIVPAYQDVLKLEWDGTQDTGKVTKLKKNFDFAKGEQFHSAKADVKGRLWVGTYQVINREKYEFVEGGGSLYMITIKKDSVEIERKLRNLTFPTGLDWKYDNRFLYHADITERKIKKYKFDIDSGDLGEREVFFDLAHHPHLSGGISGLIVKKNLVAFNLYGGSALVDVDQDTSKLIYVLPTPVPQPTSLIVGGPHLDTAYVASSDFLLTDEEKQLNPFDSQALFAYTGLKTWGIAFHKILLH